MKRYDKLSIAIIRPDGSKTVHVAKMQESSDGKWMRYEDHKKAMDKPNTLEVSSVECNCELESTEKAHDRDIYPTINHFWICPAHGYKRI